MGGERGGSSSDLASYTAENLDLADARAGRVQMFSMSCFVGVVLHRCPLSCCRCRVNVILSHCHRLVALANVSWWARGSNRTIS
eukprot:scaffold83595_cov27-Tisochrysis_lutea.AAC.1